MAKACGKTSISCHQCHTAESIPGALVAQCKEPDSDIGDAGDEGLIP